MNTFYNSIHSMWKAIDWASGGKANDAVQAAKSLGNWSKSQVATFFKSLNKEEQARLVQMAISTQTLTQSTKLLLQEKSDLLGKTKEQNKEINGLRKELAAARKALRKEAKTTTGQEELIERQEALLHRQEATIQELFSKLERVLPLLQETHEENLDLKATLEESERKLGMAFELINLQKDVIDHETASRVDSAAQGVLQSDQMELEATQHLMDQIADDPKLLRDIKQIVGGRPLLTQNMQGRLANRIQVWMRDQLKPAEVEPKVWEARVEQSFKDTGSQVLFAYNIPNMGKFINEYSRQLFDEIAKDKVAHKDLLVASIAARKSDSVQVRPFIEFLNSSKENLFANGITKESLVPLVAKWLKKQRPSDLDKNEWRRLVEQAVSDPKNEGLKEHGFANPHTFVQVYGDKIFGEFHKGVEPPSREPMDR